MMSDDEYPWLAGLAELARAARRSIESAAVALGEVVLRRPDELHVRPSGTRFAGVHTVTLRRRTWSPTIEISAYLDPPTAPTCQDLERRLGASAPLPIAPDQIGERQYTTAVATDWELPERSSWVITVGRGDRVTAVAIEVPRD
jgi:hypothetical protein